MGKEAGLSVGTVPVFLSATMTLGFDSQAWRKIVNTVRKTMILLDIKILIFNSLNYCNEVTVPGFGRFKSTFITAHKSCFL